MKVNTENVTNRVPVAPFEPKLGQNESYGLQEPFKTLPALRESIFGPKSKKINDFGVRVEFLRW